MKKLLLAIVALAFLSAPAFASDTPRTPAWAKTGKIATRLATWSGLDGDDTGIPILVANCKHITVHVYSSTYGSSTITFEGSNDPVAGTSSYASAEWVGLTDPQGTTISKTADGIEAVEEHPMWVRPKTASGTGANIAVGLSCIE